MGMTPPLSHSSSFPFLLSPIPPQSHYGLVNVAIIYGYLASNKTDRKERWDGIAISPKGSKTGEVIAKRAHSG
jgi:hypothetical protein